MLIVWLMAFLVVIFVYVASFHWGAQIFSHVVLAGCHTAATGASQSCSGAAGSCSSSVNTCSSSAPSAARHSSASASALVHPSPTRHGASTRCCGSCTRPGTRPGLSTSTTPVLSACTYAKYIYTFGGFLVICVTPVYLSFIRRQQQFHFWGFMGQT